MRRGIWCITMIFGLLNVVQANADRQMVQLPEMMREHLLSNMRDHLLALEEITRLLASEQYDEAAQVAESRLGLSSLESHGASHMNRFFPKEMGQIGMEMHRAASRFALAAERSRPCRRSCNNVSRVIQRIKFIELILARPIHSNGRIMNPGGV
jgi:hypothetical protein